ncbi:uncharacterized protein LOC127846682 [Dreissena polymorpha]|uniref:uncharacterized protein LOC127846682 n=1 Tax=Dreissena polymorpha TaxID=45954 RepID=UPI00226410A4|nr:uncharacterized protein LOC127846682 [Dreissena polymorpha]
MLVLLYKMDDYRHYYYTVVIAVIFCIGLADGANHTCNFPLTNETLNGVCTWSRWLPWNCSLCTPCESQPVAFRKRGICCNESYPILSDCLRQCGFNSTSDTEHGVCSNCWTSGDASCSLSAFGYQSTSLLSSIESTSFIVQPTLSYASSYATSYNTASLAVTPSLTLGATVASTFTEVPLPASIKTILPSSSSVLGIMTTSTNATVTNYSQLGFSNNGENKKKAGMIAGSIMGGVFVIAILVLVIMLLKRKLKRAVAVDSARTFGNE